MEFVITLRKVETGIFAGFRYPDMLNQLSVAQSQLPVAQIFVPFDPRESVETRSFSFFWRGYAERKQVHWLLDRLSRRESGVRVRLIGRNYVSKFNFSPTTSCSEAATVDWHLELTHRLIDAANLPTSLGLALDTPTDEVRPSSVYVWASIDAEDGIRPVHGNAEIGVRANLQDWHKANLREVVLPLLDGAVGLEKDDVPDLYSRVRETAEELMVAQRKS